VITTPTTTIAILRGTTTDTYGDPADNATPAASGMLAALTEQTRLTTTPVDGNPRVIHYTTVRVGYGTDLRAGDRIKDERTNHIYIVDETAQVQNPAIRMDLRAEVRRIT
jgi:hypothetical protein